MVWSSLACSTSALGFVYSEVFLCLSDTSNRDFDYELHLYYLIDGGLFTPSLPSVYIYLIMLYTDADYKPSRYHAGELLRHIIYSDGTPYNCAPF